MRSEDWIEGTVLRVIDGDTFMLRVENEGPNNDYPYGPLETVQLGKGAPAPNTAAAVKARRKLVALVGGKRVHCYVLGRDQNGTLRCDVTVIG